MARINKALLIADVAEVVHRTNLVVQDPAVEKAARVAWDDIVQAGRSSGESVASSSPPGTALRPPSAAVVSA